MKEYKYVNNLAKNLTHLRLGYEYNQSLNNLSETLEEITICKLNQCELLNEKDKIKIKKIYIYANVVNEIKKVPTTIKKIELYIYEYVDYIP